LNIEIGTINLKDVIAFCGFVFGAGGAWRELWLLRKTIVRHGKKLDAGHDLMVQLATEHNINHKANIRIPKTSNGNG